MEKSKIKVKGHTGTWSVIEESYFKGQKVYLLEHERWGDEAANLWVDKDLNILIEDSYNGILDLVEAERE